MTDFFRAFTELIFIDRSCEELETMFNVTHEHIVAINEFSIEESAKKSKVIP